MFGVRKMKMIKVIIVVLIFILVGVIIFFKSGLYDYLKFYERKSSQRFEVDPLEQRAQKNPEFFPEIMSSLPEGFIELYPALENQKKKKALTIRWFETGIWFFDSNEESVFNASVHDSSFIIIYDNAYYVNEEKFSKIIMDAIQSYK
jgi:hypothetical protein